MDPIIGGALIGGASSILRGIGNIGRNRRQVKFWNMQNEYNHPRKQMQRLQEAGLNPNLIYGDSVSGATGQAGDVGTAQSEVPENPLGEIGKYIGLKQARSQVDLLDKQVETEMERKRLMANQADKAFFDASNANFGDVTNPFVSHTLEGMAKRNELLKQQAFGKQIDNEIKDATKAQAVKSIFWKAEMAKENYDGRQLQNALLELQKQYLSLGLDRNSPWYAKIFGSGIINVNK